MLYLNCLLVLVTAYAVAGLVTRAVRLRSFQLFGVEELLQDFIEKDRLWKEKSEEKDRLWKISIDDYKPIWNKAAKAYELLKKTIEQPNEI